MSSNRVLSRNHAVMYRQRLTMDTNVRILDTVKEVSKMPRVVPSQVRAYIDKLTLKTSQPDSVSLNQVGSAPLSALLCLLDEIPEELFTMDTDRYADFIT